MQPFMFINLYYSFTIHKTDNLFLFRYHHWLGKCHQPISLCNQISKFMQHFIHANLVGNKMPSPLLTLFYWQATHTEVVTLLVRPISSVHKTFIFQ